MKTIYKVLIVLGLLHFFGFNSQASDLNDFKLRFDFKRDEHGELVSVIDRSMLGALKELKSRDFIQTSMQDLINVSKEQRSKGAGGDLRTLLTQFFNAKDLTPEENRETLKNILASLDTQKISMMMQTPEWKMIYQKLDKDMAGMGDGYATLAYPNKKLYFYKRNLLSGMAKGAVSLIKSLLPFGAWIDLANFFVKKFVDTLHENKQFHKNILLFYLQSYAPSELGLTTFERDKIISSLMDDEMQLYAVWDILDAYLDWPSYGSKRYAKALAKVDKGIQKYAAKFSSLDERMGDYFYLATTKKKHSLILNFMDPAYYLTRFPSVAVNLDKRWANTLERSLYEVVKVAVRVLPWGFVGTVVDPLLNVRYKNQIQHEGALLAYLEGDSSDSMNVTPTLLHQSLNPFIMRSGSLSTSGEGQRRFSLLGDLSELLKDSAP